jgi:CubicO group peptidase (beta-lactamase class C family)
VRQESRRYAAAFLLGVLLSSCAVAADRSAARIEWLRTQLPALLREHRVPGASVAVVQDGAIAWAAGFGVRDARDGTPVTTGTVFECASLSKPVFALLAMQLQQAGRLDLDTPLVRYLGHDYLPDQPEHRLITARMVLEHRSGFPNWRPDDNGPLTMRFTPGIRYGYSGEGFQFLQRALESISGEPLDRLAHRLLFDPLQLAHTSFVWTQTIEPELASGHDKDGAFKQHERYLDANAAYTLYSTPSDYARLVLTLLRPEVLGAHALSAQTIGQMLARGQVVEDAELFTRPGSAQGTASYRALGWGIETSGAGDILQHTGSNSTGFKTFVQFSRERGSALVLFMNGDGGGAVRDIVVAAVGDP